jgi:hypothetical protein
MVYSKLRSNENSSLSVTTKKLLLGHIIYLSSNNSAVPLVDHVSGKEVRSKQL